MAKQMTEKGRARIRKPTSRKRRTKPNEGEERILQAATIYLIRYIGGLFVATDLRATQHRGRRAWIVTVTLRYPTGHEGYVGELLYDGANCSMLTEKELIDERVKKIAADPKGIREWNEFQAAHLRSGKAQHVRAGVPPNGAGRLRHSGRRKRA